MEQVLRTRLLYQSLHRIAILVVMLALLAWGGREVSFTGDAPTVDKAAQMQQWAQQSIDAQLAELGCDTHKRLSPKVAVRNAAKDAQGHQQFDTTVVRVVTFDQGLTLAKAGTVWVVGWCG